MKEFNLESRATGVNNSSNLDITRHVNYCQIDVFQDFPPASPVEFDIFFIEISSREQVPHMYYKTLNSGASAFLSSIIFVILWSI